MEHNQLQQKANKRVTFNVPLALPETKTMYYKKKITFIFEYNIPKL